MSKLVKIVKRYVGEIGTMTTEKGRLAIRVQVHDVRSVYGRWEFKVQPIGGTGDAWVAGDRIEFDVDEQGGGLI